MPKFSVIIPTYNRATLLKQALDSVFNQSFLDYEIIIVDDGSTDDTWQYLQSLKAKVTYYRQYNKGPAAARNLAAHHASGDYLAFLDSDDLWHPDTLRHLNQIIDQHPHVSWIRIPLIQFEHSPPPFLHSPLKYDSYPNLFSAFPKVCYVGSGQTCIHRDTFIRSGGYKPDLHTAEDHDLALRLGTLPNFVDILDPPLLACRVHPHNTTADPQKIYLGISQLIRSENNHLYPGDPHFTSVRRAIIAQHARSHSTALLKHSNKLAWSLYAQTFPWQLSSHAWKYVLGFPFLSLLSPR
ncbi:MAG: glycosyltransferase [Verrucomicrobiae bacterium]|nr:glycosyltransferase [Verrucomicrobiae bacterium]